MGAKGILLPVNNPKKKQDGENRKKDTYPSGEENQ